MPYWPCEPGLIDAVQDVAERDAVLDVICVVEFVEVAVKCGAIVVFYNQMMHITVIFDVFAVWIFWRNGRSVQYKQPKVRNHSKNRWGRRVYVCIYMILCVCVPVVFRLLCTTAYRDHNDCERRKGYVWKWCMHHTLVPSGGRLYAVMLLQTSRVSVRVDKPYKAGALWNSTALAWVLVRLVAI